MTIEPGSIVTGTVVKIADFGAIVRLGGGKSGLIHISELSENRVEHPKEVLKEGEVKTLRVIRIDPDNHRIGLSLRKVDSAAFADKDFKMLTEEFRSEDKNEPEDNNEQSNNSEPEEKEG